MKEANVDLARPSRQHLSEYVRALRSGWSPDNVGGAETAKKELAAIGADPEGFVESQMANSAGRQRILLQARVGDYTRNVEYEAEEKRVFPLRESYTGPQLGLYTIPLSALLTWLVLWLTRRRS
jgi:hypothetical protein